MVYDPSVIVRCELAVLYARFVRGHSAHVHEALHHHQKKLNEFLKGQMQLQMQQHNHISGLPPPGSSLRRSMDGGSMGALSGGGGGEVHCDSISSFPS